MNRIPCKRKEPTGKSLPACVIALSCGYAVGWGSFVLPVTMFLPNFD